VTATAGGVLIAVAGVLGGIVTKLLDRWKSRRDLQIAAEDHADARERTAAETDQLRAHVQDVARQSLERALTLLGRQLADAFERIGLLEKEIEHERDERRKLSVELDDERRLRRLDQIRIADLEAELTTVKARLPERRQ
jgi:hypothetical protein